MNEKTINPNPPANYTPTRQPQIELKPFRFWCQKVLPLVYGDELSYYELLCKVVDYLNKTMEDVENMDTDMTAIYEAYNNLQGYVNNYFSSLDIQQEINNKLDHMVVDGTLLAIITPTVSSETTEWLKSNITQTDSVVIDSSLLVDGTASNSAVVGKNLDYLNDVKLNAIESNLSLMSGENYGHVRSSSLTENPSVGVCLKYNVLNLLC